VDWLKQLEASSEERRYQLYVSAGDYLLFLTGVFPGYLQERSRRRGAPDIAFYEEIARQSYQSAAHFPESPVGDLRPDLLGRLAGEFAGIRTALNDSAERLIQLD